MGGFCSVHQPDVASDEERLWQAAPPTTKSVMPNFRGRMVAPNESRLSCGANLRCSQTEFYYTVRQGVHRIVDDARRQLQALVRPHPQRAESPGARSYFRDSGQSPPPSHRLCLSSAIRASVSAAMQFEIHIGCMDPPSTAPLSHRQWALR